MSPEELISRKDLTVVVTAVDANKEILKILQESGYPEELVFVWGGSTATDHEQYFGPEFIEYESEEVFVDDGCCNLRSCLALREHCTHIKKVYAFEPDPENYQVCLRNMERYGFSEVELLPFGTWSERTTLHFSMGLGGVSHVNEEGENSIPVMPIDDVVDPKERVTFLKMDIEGSELESLKGAIQLGVSPRGSICLKRAARANALLRGRAYATPQDVKETAHDVLRHRLLLTYEAEAEALTPDAVIDRLLSEIPVP